MIASSTAMNPRQTAITEYSTSFSVLPAVAQHLPMRRCQRYVEKFGFWHHEHHSRLVAVNEWYLLENAVVENHIKLPQQQGVKTF